ncbi:hypothetical protein OH492_09430 [Vibrio chagasii]|nr:hypothetical protein [Vibrio chagasii]
MDPQRSLCINDNQVPPCPPRTRFCSWVGQTSCVISTGSIAAREGGGVGAGIYAASKRGYTTLFTVTG